MGVSVQTFLHFPKKIGDFIHHLYPPQRSWGGGGYIGFTMSVCLDSENRVRSVLNGLFPYLAQMITSMRGPVAYNDIWPWPISSRSFGLGLENRVRSVAFTVLGGFFTYLVQMITSMSSVACDDLWPWHKWSLLLENVSRVTFFFQNREIWIFWQILRPWPWKKIYSSRLILSIFSTNGH